MITLDQYKYCSTRSHHKIVPKIENKVHILGGQIWSKSDPRATIYFYQNI